VGMRRFGPILLALAAVVAAAVAVNVLLVGYAADRNDPVGDLSPRAFLTSTGAKPTNPPATSTSGTSSTSTSTTTGNTQTGSTTTSGSDDDDDKSGSDDNSGHGGGGDDDD